MELSFSHIIQEKAAELHRKKINGLDFLQAVIELLVANQTELPCGVIDQLTKAFGKPSKRNSDSDKGRNRKNALKRIQQLKFEDIEPPEWVSLAVSACKTGGDAFWGHGLEVKLEEHGNILRDVYTGFKRVTLANAIHRAFYSTAVYELVHQMMKLYQMSACTERLLNDCAGLILGDNCNPEIKAAVASDLKFEYNIGMVYSCYASKMGYGCYFLIFPVPPSLYEKYLNKTSDVQVVVSHYEKIGIYTKAEQLGVVPAGQNIVQHVNLQFKEQVRFWIQGRILDNVGPPLRQAGQKRGNLGPQSQRKRVKSSNPNPAGSKSNDVGDSCNVSANYVQIHPRTYTQETISGSTDVSSGLGVLAAAAGNIRHFESQLLVPPSDLDSIHNNFITSSATGSFDPTNIADVEHPRLSGQCFPGQSLHLIQHADIIESAPTFANPPSEYSSEQFLSLGPHADIIDSAPTPTQFSTGFANPPSEYSSEQFLSLGPHADIIDSAPTPTQFSTGFANPPSEYSSEQFLSLGPHADIIDSAPTPTQFSTGFANPPSEYSSEQFLSLGPHADIIDSAPTPTQFSTGFANPPSEYSSEQFLSLGPHADIIDSAPTPTQFSTGFANPPSEYSPEQFLSLGPHADIIDSAPTSTQYSVTNPNAPLRYHSTLYM
ncbi:hypothetical protein EMCG_03619 [[Emmonsia] crescens]|uniref:Uncharacterized protein n=1 Tax=[Emmonsia] crescens TaxID=73230 RepID=A0A0G2HVU1_9EURO|nr:hypothetical protein EMCG_03619 [Emmonsia crescens UAMH 3008]